MLPPGWTTRAARVEAPAGGPDLDVIQAVIHAHESALGHGDESTRDETLADLLSHESDSALLLQDAAGVARGYLHVTVDEPGHDVLVDAYSDPESSDLALTPLLRLGLDRAADLVRARREPVGDRPWTVRAGSYDDDVAYRRALVGLGFTEARHFYRMRVDFGASPPPALPGLPAGVTLELAADEAAQRVAWAVAEEAFEDHWNHVPHPFESWHERFVLAPAHLDHGLWWIVRVDGEPAAVCIGDHSRRHVGDGYVRELGVRRAFRGRGLARMLLRRHFAVSAQQGYRGVQLGVDADNPTGALVLYESVGMRPRLHQIAYALEVTGGNRSGPD